MMENGNVNPPANPCCNTQRLCSEYECDVIATLKEIELWRIRAVLLPSQLENRTAAVELIRHIADQDSYHRTTVHLAIHMADLFMSYHAVKQDRLELVALTCFYVACKAEEHDPRIPSLGRLCSYAPNSFTTEDVKALEVIVLRFFNWHVTIPTAATFLDFFTMHSLEMDDFIGLPEYEFTERSYEKLRNEIIQASFKYLDATLMHHKMGNFQPSLLAAACVAAARCLTPNVRVWSNHLTDITGYNYQQLHGLCEVLLFELRAQSGSPTSTGSSQKRSIPESGYLSMAEDSYDDDGDDDDNDDRDDDRDDDGDGDDISEDDSDDDDGGSFSSSSSDSEMNSTTSSSCSMCRGTKRRNQSSSSSSSSSDSGETCAKRQKIELGSDLGA